MRRRRSTGLLRRLSGRLVRIRQNGVVGSLALSVWRKESMLQGLKPFFAPGVERAKPEGLAYLEALAMGPYRGSLRQIGC